MGIVLIVQSHPLNGIALLISMAVIFWCLYILRHLRNRYDRMLTGFVGMTAVIQGMRLVFVSAAAANAATAPQKPAIGIDDSINLTVAVIWVASLWALRALSRLHRRTEFALRLAEGNQAMPFIPTLARQQKPAVATESLSQVVLDAAPMAMFAVGLDGNVSYWNRAAEKELGWSRDEVLGRKLPNLVLYPADGPPDNITAATMRLKRKDGAPCQQPVRSVPIRDAKGAVNGILTILDA